MSDFISAVQYQVIWPDSGNTTYTINSASNAAHVSLDGAGIPPVARNYMPFTESDGGIDQGFRLEPRRMVWKLMIEAATEQALDAKRDALWNIFRPLDDALRLKVTKASGAVRQIDVYVDGPIEITPGPGYKNNVTVPLVAPNPLWYDPVQQVQQFPLPAASMAVVYAGTWWEWPIIKLYGQAQNLKLTSNVAIGSGVRVADIDFTGHTIPAAAVYTADLRSGQKTVVDGSTVNKLGNLASFARFPEFRLFPTPLAVGTNTIAVTHGTVNATAKVEFSFYNRYIGL